MPPLTLTAAPPLRTTTPLGDVAGGDGNGGRTGFAALGRFFAVRSQRVDPRLVSWRRVPIFIEIPNKRPPYLCVARKEQRERRENG